MNMRQFLSSHKYNQTRCNNYKSEIGKPVPWRAIFQCCANSFNPCFRPKTCELNCDRQNIMPPHLGEVEVSDAAFSAQVCETIAFGGGPYP